MLLGKLFEYFRGSNRDGTFRAEQLKVGFWHKPPSFLPAKASASSSNLEKSRKNTDRHTLHMS